MGNELADHRALAQSRLFLQSAKSVAARVEREHRWPAKTLHSEGHRLVDALACLCRRLNHGIRPPLWVAAVLRDYGMTEREQALRDSREAHA